MPDAPLCLLTIHAHPDDEASKGASTVARYKSEGARAVLVTCTGGEAGDILNPSMDLPDVRGRITAIRLASAPTTARSPARASIPLARKPCTNADQAEATVSLEYSPTKARGRTAAA